MLERIEHLDVLRKSSDSRYRAPERCVAASIMASQQVSCAESTQCPACWISPSEVSTVPNASVCDDVARPHGFHAHLAHRIPIKLVQHLPTQAARPCHPQSPQATPRRARVPVVHRIHVIQETIRAHKIAINGAHARPRRSSVRPRLRRPAGGSISNVRTLSNNCRSISISPTSLETEVFSSAAFLRTQSAASSEILIVTFLATNSV